MSKYIKNDAQAIANLDEFTLSTGIYDYLYNEWYERLSASVTLKLSEHEHRKLAFYAGMRAAQQLLAPDLPSAVVEFCKPVNGVHAAWCPEDKSASG